MKRNSSVYIAVGCILTLVKLRGELNTCNCFVLLESTVVSEHWHEVSYGPKILKNVFQSMIESLSQNICD